MSATKYKLAIVDDHQIVIDGLRSLLKGHHQYEIVIESNHPEAIPSLLLQHEIDIMLTDVMMPVMTGVELARLVKKDFPAIGAIIKAHFSLYANIGRALQKRKEITHLIAKENISKSNIEGIYRKSIIISYYIRRKKTFSSL